MRKASKDRNQNKKYKSSKKMISARVLTNSWTKKQNKCYKEVKANLQDPIHIMLEGEAVSLHKSSIVPKDRIGLHSKVKSYKRLYKTN